MGAGRSRRQEVFCIKGALRNFAKFTEKHQCQNLFLNEVASLKYLVIRGIRSLDIRERSIFGLKKKSFEIQASNAEKCNARYLCFMVLVVLILPTISQISFQ